MEFLIHEPVIFVSSSSPCFPIVPAVPVVYVSCPEPMSLNS